ncbi:hypothetical protein NC651_025757 [Populus alba x Populus x berolinensis]|nr:hypothetical protein NC651_025757 [Populus alba x Populus x berolinensis]
MRIMQALQTNLDGKSKQYRDPALTHLFLMNNIHYMVRSVRRSEAKDLLGDDWVQRHRRVVQQHANQYKRTDSSCLSTQGLTSSGGGGSAVPGEGGSGSGASRGSRLSMYNLRSFHQKQSQWTVPDTELRESLRLAVAEVLLPAYRSFIKRFGPLVESGKIPQKYIRYTAEDLERMLGEFFEGKTLNEPRRKSPTLSIINSCLVSKKIAMENNISPKDKEDETKECVQQGVIYGSCATPRDFEIYASNASFEDPLMCAHGVKQIKSAFYSLSKIFSESRIVEYSVKEKAMSPKKQEILIDNKQNYKFLGRSIDMISLIKLYVEDGKVVRHEDWWDKKPLGNRETINFPLAGRFMETLRRGSMLATHAMMGFGKDPTIIS